MEERTSASATASSWPHEQTIWSFVLQGDDKTTAAGGRIADFSEIGCIAIEVVAGVEVGVESFSEDGLTACSEGTEGRDGPDLFTANAGSDGSRVGAGIAGISSDGMKVLCTTCKN